MSTTLLIVAFCLGTALSGLSVLRAPGAATVTQMRTAAVFEPNDQTVHGLPSRPRGVPRTRGRG